MALLIDAAYELFGFFLRPWVDVAQQTIHGKDASSNQVGRVLDGLWWHMIHLDHHSSVIGYSATDTGCEIPFWPADTGTCTACICCLSPAEQKSMSEVRLSLTRPRREFTAHLIAELVNEGVGGEKLDHPLQRVSATHEFGSGTGAGVAGSAANLLI
jgi:hypothetical protein